MTTKINTYNVRVELKKFDEVTLDVDIDFGFVEANEEGGDDLYLSESDGVQFREISNPIIEAIKAKADGKFAKSQVSEDSSSRDGIWISHFDDELIAQFDGSVFNLVVTATNYVENGEIVDTEYDSKLAK